MLVGMKEDGPRELPRVRQNLRLMAASPDEDGEPRWQIFDPLSNKFFFLSRAGFYLFREWRNAKTDDELVMLLVRRGLDVAPNELEFFIRFLELNHLVEIRSSQDFSRLQKESAKRKQHILMWVLHNYLFIKIPLVRPDLWLNRCFSRIKFLFRLRLHWVALLLGILGLVMVLRQWETFTHTLQNFFDLSSIVYYVCALILVKTAHELGHAFVAKRYGCRVSSMGFALLLMTPILYTDTTDAWRLRSRFQRLSIVTAGVRVEIYIACVATFLWGIVPDGGFRSVLFFVATTSWVSSLLINISPFMRFDGYYALSDFLGMENLQPRSFLVGKWFLREKLFGFGFAPPEPLNRKKCLLMVSYAWGTWVYRFFLFIGIAVLVYYFAFKLLGIVLFLVEILWFLVFPIIKEIGVWLTLRKYMTINKASIATLSVVLLMLAALLVPWQNQISAPAVITFERHQTFYPSEPASVVTWQVAVDKKVKQGELLMLLESAEVEQEIRLTQVRLGALQTQWQRASSGASSSSTKLTLQTQISREQSQLQSLLERRERLVFQAPFDGYIGETLSLKKDDYVNEKMPLATLYDVQSGIVKAYISGRSVSRLKIGSEARFIGNDGTKLDTKLVVNNVLPTAITHLNYPGLSSVYDGPIAAQKMQDQIIPDTSIYEVLLSFKDTSSISRQVYGRVDLSVEPTSFLVEGGRYLYGVFIRESGF
ncbi:putative peptide zinc metalloprotease protein [Marinomonas alcarazii]|uniref:Putative peptide zinc metalloprotease protein n=1 Tax=Marinomonas alcarazii TaxID=491949 RepID=A0A318VAG5_9GAMM|nr:HlyD family efflux transporter periplasmic adaptor subunit [Marinomonas alcarazii]PYF83295.1 putative peptide zinc metalloprotease protein [Marinomonas alcarazii]